MAKKEPENCWEFQNCSPEIRAKCPAFINNSGKECWYVAGSFSEKFSCPKMLKKIYHCWECPWYKKMNRK